MPDDDVVAVLLRGTRPSSSITRVARTARLIYHTCGNVLVQSAGARVARGRSSRIVELISVALPDRALHQLVDDPPAR